MAKMNFKTSLAIGRERFISPFTMIKFLMAEEDSDAQFQLIYNDLKHNKLLPFKKTDRLEKPKSKEKSLNFRLKGNQEFSNNRQQALLYYNQSIAAAPYPESKTDVSTELALAFANRSAVYAKMKRYKAALKDIEQALFFQYPDNLKYKLFERMTECYQALGKRDEALRSCKESIEFLSLVTEPPADKLTSLTATLKGLSLGGAKPNKRRGQPVATETMPLPRRAYGQNKDLPGASDCLEIRHSEEFGYHAVSTRDINPGDILVTEESLVSLLCSQYYYAYCYHCLKRSAAMIPCKHCSLVMFCSDDCRSLAWTGYHHIECPILPLLLEYDIGHVPPLSLRMLLVSVSRYADDSLEGFWWLVRNLEDSRKDVKPMPGFGQTGQPFGASRGYAALHYLDRDRAFRVDDDNGQKNIDVFLVSAINASIIVNCLECHTGFFRATGSGRPSVKDLKTFVGRLIMRYHQIIPANSRSVYDFEYDSAGESFYGTDYGVAIHNVMSFFNHSCCNNTSLFPYNGDCSFLAANQPIKKGEQLFVAYGSNYTETSLIERTTFLLKLNTICCCEACINNWPTADEMMDNSLPKMICSKCKTALSNTYAVDSVRCHQCRTRKKVMYTAKLQNSKAEKLRTINRRLYRRSYLHKDFVPDLADNLTFIFQNFQMPNVMSVLAQHCLFENFRRYSNYSDIWDSETSEKCERD